MINDKPPRGEQELWRANTYQQASRIATIILFALMQFFAPLVHAHAGGGQFSGAIHVPGLEFLDVANGKSAQAFAYKASTGTLVGVATGLRNQGDDTNATPDADFDLPPKFLFELGLPSDSASRFPILLVTPPRLFWLASAPRAPPSLV